MVLDKIFSKDKKDVSEVNSEIQQVEQDILETRGEQRLENFKKNKRKELKSKKRQLKKQKFKQSKAGKVLNAIGEGLEDISEQTGDKQTSSALSGFAEGIEKIDGDGKGDSRSSLGIGLENPNKNRKTIELDGDVIVEGNISNSKVKKKKRQSGGIGKLSSEMEDII